MNRKLKKILISNDDGIQAEGIQTLTKKLREYGHDVYVVAPSEDSSGMSHGITLKMPLRYKEFELDGAFFGYMINGKPADCVKMARWEIYKDIEFDLMISGINRGANLGADLFYSGTFGAAAEATLLNIKSIAVSLCEPFDEVENYDFVANFITKFLQSIDNIEFLKNYLINILPYKLLRWALMLAGKIMRYGNKCGKDEILRGIKYLNKPIYYASKA